jgi:hypothetical protein
MAMIACTTNVGQAIVKYQAKNAAKKDRVLRNKPKAP